MTRIIARGQTLPPEEVALLQTLPPLQFHARAYALHEAGWPLRAIGEAVGKSRSTIHYLLAENPAPTEMPKVPKPKPKYSYVPKRVPRPIPLADEARIRELAPIAKRYRSVMSPEHPAAKATQELTDLYKELHASGCSATELAKVGGVTYRAIKKRLDS